MNVRTRISRVAVSVVCLGVILGTASAASACPSCQAALNSDGSQGDLARGIYYSILFMMSMPFAIVGTFAGLMYRAVKREQKRVAESNERAGEDSPSQPAD